MLQESHHQDRPISETVVLWFDQLAQEYKADGYSLFKLYLRYLNYYSARMSGFRIEPGEPRWRGECPLCPDEVVIDTVTGWWICHGCSRQGEVYAYEYLRFGQDDPLRWETCRAQADALMAGGVPADRDGGV